MGNNQGNKKGSAQDKRELANQVEKGDSKASKNTKRTSYVPPKQGGALGRGSPDSEPGSGST